MKKLPLFVFVMISTMYGKGVDDLSVFNTPLPTSKGVKAKECWKVCKEQLAEAEKLQKALDFYKNSPYYSFSSSKNRSK